MSSFWLCGGVGRAARMSTLFTSNVTDSVRAESYLEQNYKFRNDELRLNVPDLPIGSSAGFLAF